MHSNSRSVIGVLTPSDSNLDIYVEEIETCMAGIQEHEKYKTSNDVRSYYVEKIDENVTFDDCDRYEVIVFLFDKNPIKLLEKVSKIFLSAKNGSHVTELWWIPIYEINQTLYPNLPDFGEEVFYNAFGKVTGPADLYRTFTKKMTSTVNSRDNETLVNAVIDSIAPSM